MSVPVISTIMDDLEAVVNGVTTDNGYNYNLTAYRPTRWNFEDAPMGSGTTLIIPTNQTVEEITHNTADYHQEIELQIAVIDDDDNEVKLDQRMLTMREDLVKALLVDPQRDGNAQDTLITGSTLLSPTEEAIAAIILNITVIYRTAYADPFTGA